MEGGTRVADVTPLRDTALDERSGDSESDCTGSPPWSLLRLLGASNIPFPMVEGDVAEE
jgi:hypothetical protein